MANGLNWMHRKWGYSIGIYLCSYIYEDNITLARTTVIAAGDSDPESELAIARFGRLTRGKKEAGCRLPFPWRSGAIERVTRLLGHEPIVAECPGFVRGRVTCL